MTHSGSHSIIQEPVAFDYSAYLRHLVSAADVSDATMRKVVNGLFLAKAVKQAMDAVPLAARTIMDREIARGRDTSRLDRADQIDVIVREFGFDACVRVMSSVGVNLHGVELPDAVAKLGARPSIRFDGRTIYQERPSLVRQIFDLLAVRGEEAVQIPKQLSRLMGLQGKSGVLSLHHDDGRLVEEAEYTSTEPSPQMAPC